MLSAVEVARFFRSLHVQRRKRLLPGLPRPNVARAELPSKAVQQAGQRPVPGLGRVATKAQRQHELAADARQIHLAGEGHVAVLGPLVGPGHLLVSRQVLPAVRDADEAGRAFQPGHGAGQGQGGACPLGKEHGHALVLADPGGVAAPRLPRCGASSTYRW